MVEKRTHHKFDSGLRVDLSAEDKALLVKKAKSLDITVSHLIRLLCHSL